MFQGGADLRSVHWTRLCLCARARLRVAHLVTEEPDSDALFSPRRKRGGLCEMMLLRGVALFFQTGRIVSGVFLLYFLMLILR